MSDPDRVLTEALRNVLSADAFEVFLALAEDSTVTSEELTTWVSMLLDITRVTVLMDIANNVRDLATLAKEAEHRALLR